MTFKSDKLLSRFQSQPVSIRMVCSNRMLCHNRYSDHQSARLIQSCLPCPLSKLQLARRLRERLFVPTLQRNYANLVQTNIY